MVRRYRKRKATSIEVKIASFLRESNIYYRREYRVDNYPVDFYIPKVNLVIQAQGCYYHGLECCIDQFSLSDWQKARKIKDKARDAVCKIKGLRVLNITECEINNDWEDCKNKILRYMSL